MKRTANLVGGPGDGAEIHGLDPALGKEGFPKLVEFGAARYVLAAVHTEYDGDETWHAATYVHESFRGYVPK